MGTTSPALVVPQDKTNENAMKTQTIPRQSAKKDSSTTETTSQSEGSNSALNRVGHSVFYDCLDGNGIAQVPPLTERSKGDGAEVEEKQDIMKPERNDTDDESEYFFIVKYVCTLFLHNSMSVY